MTRWTWLTRLLTIGAVLELGAGLGLVEAPASIGVGWAFLVHNILAFAVVAWIAASLPTAGALAAVFSALHAVLGAALLAVLIQTGESDQG